MNICKTLIMSATALLGATGAQAAEADESIIDRTDFVSKTGIFDIDALEALGRVTAPAVSPDGKTVLFGISYESLEQNKSNNDLYTVGVNGGEITRLTRTPKSEGGAVWIDGGRRIAFLYPDADGKTQMWTMNADGSDRVQASQVEGGIEGFLFSPDQSKVIFVKTVKYVREAKDIYPDLPQATGRVIDDLMYKHWDEWVTAIPHPWVADFDGKTAGTPKDIMDGEPYEAPMRPFGGVEQLAWAPDGKGIVYVSRKKTGVEYAISTNSDLYLYDIASGKTENLTEGMMGYDINPAFSPDGRYMAWLSMENDGYESDKNRLFVMDWATREKTDLTSDWDFTIDEFAWNHDSKNIWFIAPHLGTAPVFNMEVATKKVTEVASGMCDYTGLSPVDAKNLVVMNHSMLRPNEIVKVTLKGKGKKLAGTTNSLTDINGGIFSQLTMPTVEATKVPTTDGKEMLTWLVRPQNYKADATAEYPALLYCQGGPQQPVSQFWSYRWNLALMAANGYVVIAPNRRGVPGFGSEWLAQISKDYPGQNMKDYLAAVDETLKNNASIDPKRVGATGASYGGFSVYWLAGNHNHRFSALLAHAGIFNMEAQYLETEEMWFANWDMGGAFWDKDNKVAQRTFEYSPHRFVDRWDTPIMISHGDFDYRILSSQGQQAFNAAKLRGIPAEMVLFPDENHWILKPQNAVMWQRLFFRWFDRWLKK